jgi:hypothetical protein
MKRLGTHFTVLASLLLLASLIAGCGSGNREGTIGPDVALTGTVQKGDPALASAAGYIGSEACKNCHPTQFTGWSKSLHNFPLKTVAELGDAIFVNDADGNGQDDFKDTLDFNNSATDSLIEANANGTALKNSRPNAPILKIVNGKHIISIAGVEFEIQRTQGGNGLWKQRYQTKVGKSYYISPVQYNEISKKYEAYNASHWYSGTPANTPRYTQAYGTDALVAQFGALNTTATKLGTARSWENRCSGCHQTGLTLDSQTQAYAGDNVTEVVSGYVELNIGCEACHGPGAQHVNSSGNPAFITNPANLERLGVGGIRLADQVCGNCHQRGEGRATLAGMSLNTEFPARLVGGVLAFPFPGESSIDNSAGNPFVILNTTTAYYGAFPSAFKANGTRDIFSDYRNWYLGYNFPIYIASLQHHQAWTDLEQGPHGPDKATDTTCFGCHDPHEGKGDHQVKDSITRNGVTFATQNDDNSLCLACHHDFFGLTAGDVKTNPAAVETAVVRHIGEEAQMAQAPYNPAGTGVGRCSKCHMPKTASSAIRTTFGLGLQEGDIHNHTFNIIWPSVNVVAHDNGQLKINGTPQFVGAARGDAMVNSCYGTTPCHSNDPGSVKYIKNLTEWSRSKHADFTSEPFRHFDIDGSISASCAKCHSKYGYVDFVKDGVVNAAAKLGSKISCAACHSEDGDGTTRYARRTVGDALDNVVFPSGAGVTLGDASNLCMICHQGRNSKVQVDDAIVNDPSDNSINNLTFVNIHYFAASATLFGTEVKGGYEYGDNVYAGRLAHVPARDTCIECHMGRTADLNESNHIIFPKTEYCALCHPVPVPDNTADAARFRSIRFPPIGGIDYNGNGNVVEGIYQEIWGTGVNGTDNVVNRLLLAIQAYAAANRPAQIAYDPATNPYWFKDNNGNGIVDANEAVNANRYNVFDAKLLKAAYNYHVVQKEPCGYVHNPRYVLQLLFDSIRDLDPAAAVAPTVLIRP